MSTPEKGSTLSTTRSKDGSTKVNVFRHTDGTAEKIVDRASQPSPQKKTPSPADY